MKALLLPFLLCAAALAEPTVPAVDQKPAATVVEKPIAKLAKLETRERYTFIEVQILEKVPDGVYIRHKEGVPPRGVESLLKYGGLSFIPYESLPDAVRKQMGGFTAPEARKFREKKAEADKVGDRHILTEHKDFIAYDPKGDRNFAGE
ncbi:hypothetical protein OKA04_15825 [Luteolibacter flavescens]|uniref:Uncharacterized protein n=1 Tax=Luteolibacter flavescens TaxID=1859460 RepID=A0ABT3FRX8_9BACT|nr:hypothetical protein [Luteolibacter flavescens]MCW1886207.1 hypothetical protein [Luteolibacter flavescens]